MDFWWIVIVLVVVVAVLLVVLKVLGKREVEKFPYRLKKYFFTKSEQEFFRILDQEINAARFTIFPKVRLADFVEITIRGEEWLGKWNKIRSKHVDYLIWDLQEHKVRLAIELDGSSHNSEKMQKSDDFKDEMYPAIGLELIRVRVGSDFKNEVQKIVEKVGWGNMN